MPVIPVILAGGSGTRLWPLSRPGTPKQFIRLFGERTLLQETLERVLDHNYRHILVVTLDEHRRETEAQLAELGLDEDRVSILAEPCARNTAPAIGWAAAWIRDCFGLEARMVVLPADHHIGDRAAFDRSLGTALEAARDDVLVCLGVQPTHPETGYGYIQAGGRTGEVAEVHRFVEKPGVDQATRYVRSGEYFWNSGIFVWKSGALLDAMARHMPSLASLVERPWCDIPTRYASAPDQSIDYGVLEKASNVRMVLASFAWSDVGTWDALIHHWRNDGKETAPSVQLDTRGVDVFSDRPVGVIGLQDVLVVDTDEGLLIMKKGHGQDVGAVARTMLGMTPQAVATGPVPRVVPKPWGQELIWAETGQYVGKTLSIQAGAQLSLQYHRVKDETIHVLSGELILRHGADADALAETRMSPGESFRIPSHTVHQLKAITACEILEVSTPHLADVVRLRDTPS